MKKILIALIGIGLILFTAEGDTNEAQLAWSGTWFTVVLCSALGLRYLEKKEGHHE